MQAKATLKKIPLNSANDPDGELQDLFWSIVNEQNMQITFMEGWLVGENRQTYLEAICSQAAAAPVTTNATVTPTVPATTAQSSAESDHALSHDLDDCRDERESYLVWAAVMTALLIATWLFIIFTKMNSAPTSGNTSGAVVTTF